ncbi:hypothetical protein GCM10027300_05670 [Modestobacter lapidis]
MAEYLQVVRVLFWCALPAGIRSLRNLQWQLKNTSDAHRGKHRGPEKIPPRRADGNGSAGAQEGERPSGRSKLTSTSWNPLLRWALAMPV